jgi:hypothetical protein
MIFTLTEVNEQIADYKKALMAVSHSQEYRIDGKRMTRADLPQIIKTLEWLDNEKSKIVNNSSGPHILSGRVNRG